MGDGDKKRARRRALAMLAQAAIGGLIAWNYTLHVVWRPVRWNGPVFLGAHAVLALTLWSWGATVTQRPNTAHVQVKQRTDWETCKRTGLLLPPRSRMWHDEMILGFDHYCGWLGVPIGLHNRKAFVLFLGYGCLLTAVSAALLAYDLSKQRHLLEDSGVDPSRSSFLSDIGLFLSPGYLLLVLFQLAGRVSLEGYTAFVDLVVAALLLAFATYNMRLVLRNATTIDPRPSRYDVGRAANVRQVFGRKAALWWLPLEGEPTVDGVDWPQQ